MLDFANSKKGQKVGSGERLWPGTTTTETQAELSHGKALGVMGKLLPPRTSRLVLVTLLLGLSATA